jgi:hypothetical protein
MKNILVFGMTQASANRFLQKFAMKRNDKKSLYRDRLELLNGNYYKAVSIGNDYSCCGSRCNIAYVQKGIGEYLLYSMVYPCFVNDYDITYFKGD